MEKFRLDVDIREQLKQLDGQFIVELSEHKSPNSKRYELEQRKTEALEKIAMHDLKPWPAQGSAEETLYSNDKVDWHSDISDIDQRKDVFAKRRFVSVDGTGDWSSPFVIARSINKDWLPKQLTEEDVEDIVLKNIALYSKGLLEDDIKQKIDDMCYSEELNKELHIGEDSFIIHPGKRN